jgi:anti-sigma B factor antagonist
VSEQPNLTVDYFGSVPVVRLTGDLDILQASRLRERLLTSVANADTALVVDLSDVRYIDSSGVNVMFELAERLAKGQIEFGVVIPATGLVERVLRIVDLGSVAAVHDTLEACLAAMPKSA